MRVLLQILPSPDVTSAVIDAPSKQVATDVAGDIPGVELDTSYSPFAMPMPLPRSDDGDPLSLRQPLTFSMEPDVATVLVRGEIADDELGSRLPMLTARYPHVVGIFADPAIGPLPNCPDHPVGKWEDVAQQLHVADLHEQGLDGSSVPVAVLDTGINIAHLAGAREGVQVDLDLSWSPPSVGHVPGRFPVGHGTMCAFNVLIAAPSAQLLDLPVLRSRAPGRTVMEGLLSDAVAAFAHLRRILDLVPEVDRALVVSNSWGPYGPQQDFVPGHPGNYSDSLAHPFNQAVMELESAGADILFAMRQLWA